MRILQLIDSLETGGAEKMAVNYANALARRVEFSGLVATRKEGGLKSQLSPQVSYLFLEKRKAFDIKALLRLKNYCRENKIEYIQAHSSSYFTAVMLKMLMPKIKIIWHAHLGASEFLSNSQLMPLRLMSRFFSGTIVVNDRLKKWAEHKLHSPKTVYLPNFTNISNIEKQTDLHGSAGKRILCLANLRPDKNHFLLLETAKKIIERHPDWTFHLVGKDFKDDYSKVVKAAILENKLESNVFIYGGKNDVQHIISQSDVAILTSKSEGLPVALLEYGLNKKPVVVTAVGEIPQIVRHRQNGFIVAKDDIDGFYNSLLNLIEDESLRLQLGIALEQTIQQNHSERAAINKLMVWLNSDDH